MLPKQVTASNDYNASIGRPKSAPPGISKKKKPVGAGSKKLKPSLIESPASGIKSPNEGKTTF
jgi:hypothetical protein